MLIAIIIFLIGIFIGIPMLFAGLSDPIVQSASDGDVTVNKLFSGDIEIVYPCPKCKHNLKSPVSDVSSQDICPKCEKSFIVPGAVALKKLNKQIADEKFAAQAKINAEKQRLKDEQSRIRREQDRILAEINNPLANCRACKTEVAKIANTCPKCGCPNPYIVTAIEKNREQFQRGVNDQLNSILRKLNNLVD